MTGGVAVTAATHGTVTDVQRQCRRRGVRRPSALVDAVPVTFVLVLVLGASGDSVGPTSHVLALQHGGPISGGLAFVDAHPVATGAALAATADRVPAAHALREEQLEEQPLKLFAENHVDDEVNG